MCRPTGFLNRTRYLSLNANRLMQTVGKLLESQQNLYFFIVTLKKHTQAFLQIENR